MTKIDFTVTSLNEMVEKVPPVVAKPTKEKAVYTLNWLSATGSGIFLAAIVAGLFMNYSIAGLFGKYFATIWLVRYSLITIAAMLALGFVTRYSGTDATLGLAFAKTGVMGFSLSSRAPATAAAGSLRQRASTGASVLFRRPREP